MSEVNRIVLCTESPEIIAYLKSLGYSDEQLADATIEAKQREQEPEEISVKPDDFSDAGNAEIFVCLAGDRLVYCDALGWLNWDGKRWVQNDHYALKCATTYTQLMLDEAREQHQAASAALDEVSKAMATNEPVDIFDSHTSEIDKAKAAVESAKKYLAHALKSRNFNRLKAICELSKPYLLHSAADFDAEPHILNTPNGIVDLTTGQLRPHALQAYCSKMTAVSPSSENASMWEEFLDTITCGDGSLRGYLQLIAGMALVGKVYQEGMIIAHGNGANGKSTFFNALGAVMGDYFGTINVDVLTTKEQNRGAALATLRGKRLVVAGELEEFQRLSPATVKRICSTDEIMVEEKYKAPEAIQPSHTICLFTNFMPRVSSTDDGIWRRLFVVPFNAKITGDSDIKNYASYLVEHCGGAILQWAIDGAVMFCRNGFKIQTPDIVAEATEEYQQREDWLENFINDCCVIEPNARVTAGSLIEAYKQWAKSVGEYEGRRGNEIYAAMIAAGYHQTKPGNTRTWIGLRLRTPTTDRFYSNGTKYA